LEFATCAITIGLSIDPRGVSVLSGTSEGEFVGLGKEGVGDGSFGKLEQPIKYGVSIKIASQTTLFRILK
jgi:hypothetical protein